MTGKRLVGISDKGAIVADRFGREEEIPCDSLVLAIGLRPKREFIDGLAGEKGIEVFEIGDCVAPRRILDAVARGIQGSKVGDRSSLEAGRFDGDLALPSPFVEIGYPFPHR